MKHSYFARRRNRRGAIGVHSLLYATVLIFFITTVCCCDEPLPARYLDKVESTPDFCQGDRRFGAFPGNGEQICGPVALSNSLCWLNQHGYSKLLNKPNPTMADQAELIRRLCKDEFLGTDLESGTPPKKVILGIEKFIKAAGYDCKIEQMSWRSSTYRIGKVPDEKWMLKSCMGASNLLINVGWYTVRKNTYHRLDGHWVTLVGFKEDRGNRILLIHDPGMHGGNLKKTEPCRLIPLPAEHTLEMRNGESFKVDGYFKLHGIHIKKGADLAIVDGAVSFTPIEVQK